VHRFRSRVGVHAVVLGSRYWGRECGSEVVDLRAIVIVVIIAVVVVVSVEVVVIVIAVTVVIVVEVVVTIEAAMNRLVQRFSDSHHVVEGVAMVRVASEVILKLVFESSFIGILSLFIRHCSDLLADVLEGVVVVGD
jgi:hypothetical protein